MSKVKAKQIIEDFIKQNPTLVETYFKTVDNIDDNDVIYYIDKLKQKFDIDSKEIPDVMVKSLIGILLSKSDQKLIEVKYNTGIEVINNFLILKTEERVYGISIECLKEHLPDYKFSTFINCGANGCVFNLCKESKCNFVIKLIVVNDNSITSIIEEFKITELVGNLGIGAKVLKYFDCPGGVMNSNKFIYESSKDKSSVIKTFDESKLFLIAMEKLGMPLTQYIKLPEFNEENKKIIQKKIHKLVKKLHKLNIVHLDLHEGNILISSNGEKVTDVKIIDYGSSVKIDNNDDKLKRLIKIDQSSITLISKYFF